MNALDWMVGGFVRLALPDHLLAPGATFGVVIGAALAGFVVVAVMPEPADPPIPSVVRSALDNDNVVVIRPPIAVPLTPGRHHRWWWQRDRTVTPTGAIPVVRHRPSRGVWPDSISCRDATHRAAAGLYPEGRHAPAKGYGRAVHIDRAVEQTAGWSTADIAEILDRRRDRRRVLTSAGAR